MNCSKSFRSENYENVDRLSELPDSLILQILSCLPMKDVVRTTLLSKRWENLWTTVPCLTFNDDIEYYDEEDTESSDIFIKFVDRALTLWNGGRIQKFGIFLYCFEDSMCSHLDKWLDFALERQVEELYIDLECDLGAEYNVSLYFLPQRLYSCSSIRKLSVVSCRLEPNGDVHWDNLKSLSIRRVCLAENVMNQIWFGSPQLEVLILRLFVSRSRLNIRSISLKKLTVEKELDWDGYADMDTVLTIWAPNVEILEMSGLMYEKYSLMDVSSLIDVTLAFSDDNLDCFCTSDGIVYDFLNEMLMQVFQSIRHVQNITLSDWCVEVLQSTKDDVDSFSSDAKFLKFCICDGPHLYIEYQIKDVLKMFPKLTMLVLEDANLSMYKEKKCIVDPVILKFDKENLLKSKKRFRKSPLPHLRTVKIKWAGDTTMIIRILQEYVNKIGKVVARPTHIRIFSKYTYQDLLQITEFIKPW